MKDKAADIAFLGTLLLMGALAFFGPSELQGLPL